MARAPGAKVIYEVADLFRQRCLIEGKSLLWPQCAAWTLSNTTALRSAFMGQPDTGKRTFLEKWHDQLLNEQEDVHRVAVELIALYQLFPTNIGPQAKLKELDTIIGWKLSQDRPDLSLLERAYEHGLGNPGIYYLTGKPWQIAFYLQFSIHTMREKIDLGSAEACKQLANRVRGDLPQGGGARHILLHLFFPDQFERIASEGQRRRIVEVFSAEAEGNSDQDSALLHIRKALQQRFGRETIEFWDKDIQPLWKGGEAESVNFWIEKTIVKGRPNREEGEYAVGKALWSPKQDKRGGDIYRFMREVRSGDVVLHLTDNEAFTAISRMESSFENFGGVAGAEWDLGPSYLVRLCKGLYRSYVELQANLAAVRGRINFAEDARQNYILRQRTYCRFDEFTWDIPENQVIRQISHFLSGWRFLPQTRLRLGKIDTELADVTRTQFSATDLNKIHYHRLNEDYRPLHQLCRLFLEGASLSEDLGIFSFRAFLLDMNKLFEDFVCQILRERALGKLRVDSQEWVYLDRDKRILMKPDILVRRGGSVVLSADCKYKKLEEGEFKNHDIYQLLAYCTATNTHRGLLVYPLHLKSSREDIQINNTETSIRQITIDLGKEFNELIHSCDSFADEVFAFTEA